MTTRIRNTAGGDSAYTLEHIGASDDNPTGARAYLVRKGATHWQITGHDCATFQTNATTPHTQTPPAYVLARVHQEWARDQLRDTLKPGATVYTTLNHVSSSGMFRRIGVRAIVNNEPQYLDGLVMIALGIKHGDKDGVPMGGCGMDMGFALVYDLSYALYGSGFKCTGKNCPSNDHSNDYGSFSHTYNEEHAKDAPSWLTYEGFYDSEGLTDEEQEQRSAYREDKATAWKDSERARYSRRRQHSSGGYALKQRWL